MCHQTVSLVARHLEANGIPTLCLGSALDILQAGRPARAVFLDYPLGHSAGKPFDLGDQLSVIRAALQGFETIKQAGEILCLPNTWEPSGSWQESASSTQAEDARQPRDETPQFQWPADREAAIAAGALVA